MKILTKAQGAGYSITSSNGLADSGATLEAILKDGRTYKSSSIIDGAGLPDASIATDSQSIVGILAKDAQVGHWEPTTIVSNSDGFPVALVFSPTLSVQLNASGASPLAITMYAGTAYDYPEIPNGNFTPPNFNSDVTYNNNISGMGEFVGRSVVRRASSVGIQTLAFRAQKSQLDDVYKMLEEMREAPFFLQHKANGVEYSYYGWTSGEPQLSYVGQIDYVQIQFDMTVRGYSIR